uniref:Uncharacterized protein n=1 Tax=Amphimedon queenslandica TaxID=400682 RepID=A0A1X7UIS4_AMPQE
MIIRSGGAVPGKSEGVPRHDYDNWTVSVNNVQADGCKEKKEDSGYSWSTIALYGGVAVLGAGVAVAAAPVAVGALGFGASGIASGSIGASMMSAMGPVASGSIVATMQSVGAAGLGAAGNVIVGTTGAVIATGTTAAVTKK